MKIRHGFSIHFFIEALLDTTTMHEIAKWINERIESNRVVLVALETSFHRKYCISLITIIIEINDNDFAKKTDYY